jgi:hypothetical protein
MSEDYDDYVDDDSFVEESDDIDRDIEGCACDD